MAVTSYNGGFSTAPYSLQAEMSLPLDLGSLGGACSGAPLVGPADATSSVAVLHDHTASDDLSVFFTQKQRVQALYGLDEAAMDAAKKYQFTPAVKSGKRVKVWYDLPIFQFTPPK